MTAATLSGAIGASAAEMGWINTSPVESRWEDADNWGPAATPAPGDIVTIGTGNSGLYTDVSVGTVNVDGGVLWINRNGVLNAGTVNVSDGQLALSKGNPTAPTNPGPQGIANISTLLNITGGTVERFGLIDLGDTGSVAQTGGSVLNPVQIHTPSYVQTGGSMVGQVTTSTYAISGAEGAAESLMAGSVYLGGQFTMADGARVSGWIAGGGSATMLQSGGTLEGSASGLASYTQTGGTVDGDIEFSDLYELSGDGQIGWVNIIGSTEAEFKQSGGISGGIVFAPVGTEDWNSIWTGIEKYTQTGGDMSGGWVITRTYEASGGSVNGSVDFLELFALSGDASVGDDFHIMGGRDAVMTQSGGSMGGDVYGKNDHHDPQKGSDDDALAIASYIQSGGGMTGFVSADNYALSGGTLSGTAAFSSFELIGGEVTASGSLIGASGSTVKQTGGTMGGNVSGIASYAMSGGTINGIVNFADHFELSGGRIEYVDIVGDVDATMTQTGGSMGGGVYSLAGDGAIAKYTQTGGSMNEVVYARTYEASGGSVDGMVVFSDLFALSGDAVVGDYYIWGDGTAIATQSGGTMGGEVSDITDYTQSGGAMTGSVATEDFALSGGTVSGRVYFGGTFALSTDGEVMPTAALYGDWSAQMTQSGGTMGGLVTGIATYTQSGGTMSGSASDLTSYIQSGGAMSGTAKAANYALTGGTLSGDARFGSQFTLSGTGNVTAAGKLIGDGSATMTQTGGTMAGAVSGITGYTQTGGAMGGTVTSSVGYSQSGGTIGGTVNAQTYALSAGTLSGTANFGTSVALSGTGNVTAAGQLIGDGSATMVQTGGAMDGAVSGINGYTQSGGAMGGKVTTTTYDMSGGTLTGEVAGFSSFELSGDPLDAIVSGALVGASGSTVTQVGGRMDGIVSGIANYVQQERVGSSAVISFSRLYELLDGQVEAGATIIGGAGSAMTQAGPGNMRGTVTGVASYSQSAGTMNGSVSTGSYELTGGTVSGTVNFSDAFTFGTIGASQSGQINGSAVLVGGAASTVMQSGGSMKGTVDGVGLYSQTAGDMGGLQAITNRVIGTVETATYALSGGTVAGQVDFSSLFTLSGTGVVTSTAQLIGSPGSTMTQSASTMGGTVSEVASYAQSGGTMAGTVTGETYGLSAGLLTGNANVSTLFALSATGEVTATGTLTGGDTATVTQSGGTMDGTVTGAARYAQSGGTMSGSVSAADYALAGGTLTGDAIVSGSFALSGSGSVTATAHLAGSAGATLVQSGGSMQGTVTAIDRYGQSAGTMSGSVTTQNYALAGGTLTGDADFSTLFALSDSGSVSAAGHLTGGTGSTMTQSGGSMQGTVTGIDSYTQSGGTLTGAISTLAFEHAGGNAIGSIDVATYTLSGAGATWDGTITASDAVNLGVDGGAATVAAKLSGAANVVKSGTSTVVLANDANDFTGSVTVNGGVLEIQDAALPGQATVVVANDATLRFNTSAPVSALFDGSMSGATGVLEKTGLGTLTLSGDINLGALQVHAGVLNIGNGDPEEASFDSAHIAVGATVYVASGATLRIRVPKNIANFGTLTNDGTVYDDLDNAGMFVNNAVYVADVASNISDIANNAPGVWTGDVLTNNGWINNNENATWNGNVVSNAALGTNGKPGRIANAGGTWRGDILSNAGDIINDNRADEIGIGYWIGDIVSNTNWIFNGGGGDWTGDVISNAGLVMNGKPAVWHGDVRSNANEVWNGGIWNGKVLGNAGLVHNAGGTWNGNVEANTGLIKNIAGTDAHGSTGGSTWVGDVLTNSGSILNAADSTWSGNVLANSGTIRNLGLWTGNFNNAGTVRAQNQIVGTFANSGTLRLTGNLSGITTLTNSGTIDMTGGGAQVLSVASATFASGSFLDLQIDPNGTADQVAVSGLATLGGTVRVSNGGSPHTNGPFTILTAGSISGTFDAVTTDLAFLTPQLSYDTQSVSVAIQRNDRGFAVTGATGNQRATGAAVEALGADNALYDAVLWLTQAEAQSAFSQLSGEPHSSQASGAMENANAISQMAGNRVEQAFAALDDGTAQISNYVGSELPMPDAEFRSNAVWGQLYGGRGSVDAAGGHAGVASINSGVVLGLDGLVGDWRLGLLLQGGLSDTQLSTLNASANSTDYGLGIYGGREFGDTLLSFGATYTRHDNRTTRQISFPGFIDKLSASYASSTAQGFVNVSHEFDFGAVSLKPYGGLAYVSQASDSFTETGGAAALSSTANLIDATFASLGLGVERQFVVGADMLLTAGGSIGWRHAFAETPISTNRFGTGPSFTITGKPAVSDMLTLGAGLALDVGGGVNLDLTYTGQIGGGTQIHALQGIWSQRF